jgi:MSHA biogenesis protein MshJ
MVFAASAAAIVFVAHSLVLGPMLRKHAALRSQISQQQNNLAGIDGEITQKVQAWQLDPDAGARERLAAVKAEAAQLAESLRAMQKGLVPPERMAPLLDTILRANGRLQLVSMKTLPVGSVNEMASTGAAPTATQAVSEARPAPDAAKPATPGSDMLYRHGVEITVREVHVEAGAKLNASLVREGCVDELLVYLAPCLIGAGQGMFALPPLSRLADKLPLRFHEFKQVGADVRILARFIQLEE